MVADPSTTIRRVLVRGAAGDTPAARLSLTDLLSTADLRPRDLGPRAVLIVRRIGDPVPGSLSLRHLTPRARRKWTRALQQSVDECRRRAFQPARDAVPGDAEAVLFADEAELRACLIRDLLFGTAGDRWWWRAWLAGRRIQPPAAAVLSNLMDAPQIAPAVLVRASQMVPIEEIAREWTPEQIRGVIDAVFDAYRIPRAPVEVLHSDPVDPPDELDAGPAPARAVRLRAVETTTRSLLRERLPVLLMRIAASLLHRPGASEVQKAVEAWRREVLHGLTGPESAPRTSGEAAPVRRRQPIRERPEFRDSPDAAEGPRDGDPPEEGGALPAEGSTSGPDARDQAAPVPPAIPVSDPKQDVDERRPFAIRGEDAQVRSRHAPADPGAPDAPSAREVGGAEAASGADEHPSAVFPDFIDTGLAGILYLTHVLEELDLPDAFEADWHLASDAGWWGTLELIARGMLREGDDTDPIWSLLATLAGREPGDPVGTTLEEAPDFCAPEGWPSGPTQETASSGTPEQWNGSVEFEPGPLCSGLPAPLRAWLRHVLPYVHAILERRFASSPVGPPRPPERMLAVPARIFVSSTHVDVTAGLEDIDVQVRIAGLDRDPGWVPRAGRVILFHFR